MNDEKYDYKEAVEKDVRQYIEDNIDLDDWPDLADLADELRDQCAISDYVTGNASGSYYCNTWKAESALCHNFDLLQEALSEYGMTLPDVKYGAEGCDVLIRCYVLDEIVDNIIDELQEERDEEEPDEEQESEEDGDE